MNLFTHSLPLPLPPSLPPPLPPSLPHSLTHSLPPSLTHSLTHSLPPSLPLLPSLTQFLPLPPPPPHSHSPSLPYLPHPLTLVTQDQGVRYICAGVAEQQEGLFVLNLSSNGISSDGVHHVSAMLVSTLHHHCVLHSILQKLLSYLIHRIDICTQNCIYCEV